jgi:hypothetical protein
MSEIIEPYKSVTEAECCSSRAPEKADAYINSTSCSLKAAHHHMIPLGISDMYCVACNGPDKNLTHTYLLCLPAE